MAAVLTAFENELMVMTPAMNSTATTAMTTTTMETRRTTKARRLSGAMGSPGYRPIGPKNFFSVRK